MCRSGCVVRCVACVSVSFYFKKNLLISLAPMDRIDVYTKKSPRCGVPYRTVGMCWMRYIVVPYGAVQYVSLGLV